MQLDAVRRPRLEGDSGRGRLLLPPREARVRERVVLQHRPAVVVRVRKEVDQEHDIEFLTFGLRDGQTHDLQGGGRRSSTGQGAVLNGIENSNLVNTRLT